MRLDTLISRLEEERAQVAHAALTSPGREIFDYGNAVGFYAGLTKAITIIQGLIEDEAKREL